ncbi:response regulator transcription factor [Sulfurimonas sp.]|uniref:response regulator transcription factor n=1 Tax=Sulfurimonas sp. TaxID=2022749 RepID=UPI002B498834|nr:response regulator [Sulfurimonas sp.]
MKSKLRLLYAEDEKIVRDFFLEIFKRYFEYIEVAENGKQALELYEKNKFDIAILDVSMPQLNGLNVASTIRETDSDIEIIMLAAFTDTDKLLKAINLHLFSYLSKPVKLKELDSTLNRVITKLSKNIKIKINDFYHWDVKKEKLYYLLDEVKLSKKEHSLTKILIQNPHKYHTSCEIQNTIMKSYPESDIHCNNTIQLISRFKKKMLKSYNKEHFFIDNVYGLGYKIIS